MLPNYYLIVNFFRAFVFYFIKMHFHLPKKIDYDIFKTPGKVFYTFFFCFN